MRSLWRVLILMVLGVAFFAGAVRAQEDSASYPSDDSQATYAQPSEAPAYPDSSQASSQSGRNGYPPPENNSNTPDPPSRVARLQYLTGAVSVQPRGTEDWVAAALNRPLTTADNVWTDKDSRAELSVGSGVMRMGAETSLTLSNVSDNTIQLSLHQGTLNLRVRHLYRGEIYEVDTPNMAFTVQKAGNYRFDVDPNGDASVVTVWRGGGDATGDGPSVRVHEHERMRFTQGTSLTHMRSEAPPYDGFDDWCRVRDRREDSSVSARYVSPDMIGYGDLDDYGTWHDAAPYGHVWVPAVDPGWAPYRYGHWVWISPWGWTWVDDAPWGFAPFHYGRWVYWGGAWGWAPGPYYLHPVYAPALVTWFGGPGWGIGVGFGFGWCPLGWGEPFFPWYHVRPHYFQRVNITNTRITNIRTVTNNYYNPNGFRPMRFANLRSPGGLTGASREAIASGRPIARNAVQITPRQVAGHALVGRLPMNPTPQSRLGINAGRPAVAPTRAIASRPTATRLTPPASPARVAMNRTTGGIQPRAMTPSRASTTTAAPRGMAPSRNVPRPPSAAFNDRPVNQASLTPRAVPRPPTAGARGPQPSAPASNASRSVPRPPTGRTGATAAPSSAYRSSAGPSTGPAVRPNYGPGYSRPGFNNPGLNNNVPRPTGPVRPAPRAYSAPNYGTRSGPAPSYREGPSYRSPSYPGYRTGPSYSSPAPRMSAPSYSSPAPRMSAPSSRGSAPAMRSGGPSYGGGGGRSYGGGGRSYGGGGGARSSGGGHSGRGR